MHWTTKVFIVGAAILSVLLAALVMAYSVNVKEIRDSYGNLLAQKEAAEAQNAAVTTQGAAERAKLNDTIIARDNEVQSLKAQLSQLQTESSALRTDKFRADVERESVLQKIAQLSETNKTLTTLVDKQRDEVVGLRDAELKFRRREIELVDRTNDLESQREVLTQTVRALEEQVAEAKQLASAQGGGVATEGQDQTPRPMRAVQGRITEVQTDSATGETLAQINLGTNDGLRERMQLWLEREGTLMGRLTIIKSDLRTSVGRVDTMNIRDPKGKPYQVRRDDRVYSSPMN